MMHRFPLLLKAVYFFIEIRKILLCILTKIFFGTEYHISVVTYTKNIIDDNVASISRYTHDAFRMQS